MSAHPTHSQRLLSVLSAPARTPQLLSLISPPLTSLSSCGRRTAKKKMTTAGTFHVTKVVLSDGAIRPLARNARRNARHFNAEQKLKAWTQGGPPSLEPNEEGASFSRVFLASPEPEKRVAAPTIPDDGPEVLAVGPSLSTPSRLGVVALVTSVGNELSAAYPRRQPGNSDFSRNSNDLNYIVP